MAEKVELVIKIPKYYLTHPQDYTCLAECVRRGVQLPKGHDDLIDRSEVIKSLFDYHNGKKTIGQCIDDVSTIIEADVGERK